MANLPNVSALRLDQYRDRYPVHHAIACKDYSRLRNLLSQLPNPMHGEKEVYTESEAMADEAKAEAISLVIDERTEEGRETPLHLSVKLRDAIAVKILMEAGADYSLQNERGWSPLQESISRGEEDIAFIIIKHSQRLTWKKWCRRCPRIISALRGMQDFYMEVSFHFESSMLPFMARVAPSDTYKIWKTGSNLRIDMSFSGFDRFRMAQRSNRSFLFFGDGREEDDISVGSLCLLNHKNKRISDALEGMSEPISDAQASHDVAIMSRMNVYRPGIDVTNATLTPRLSWRSHEKVEMVGPWKAKLYDMNNVVMSFKSRKVPGGIVFDNELFEGMRELSDGDEEHSLIDGEAKVSPTVGSSNPRSNASDAMKVTFDSDDCSSALSSNPRHPKADKKGWLSWNRKGGSPKKGAPSSRASLLVGGGKDMQEERPRNTKHVEERSDKGKNLLKYVEERSNSLDSRGKMPLGSYNLHIGQDNGNKTSVPESSLMGQVGPSNISPCVETEFKKEMKPILWLTPEFPLKTEELLPLLDILANKVKAIRRLRELLTTKFPLGTFPVKVAIPLIPTVKMVISFTKFEEMESDEVFATPTCSPNERYGHERPCYGSWFSWIEGSETNVPIGTPKIEGEEQTNDMFAIPRDYVWTGKEAEKRTHMGKKRNKL